MLMMWSEAFFLTAANNSGGTGVAAIWGAVGVVIAAALGYLGVRYTAHASERAQRISEKMEAKAVDAAAYERARASYEAAIKQYLVEIQRLQDRLTRVDEETRRLEEARRDQRMEIDAVVEQLINARQEYEAHLNWCRDRLLRLRSKLEDGNLRLDDPDLDLMTHPS